MVAVQRSWFFLIYRTCISQIRYSTKYGFGPRLPFIGFGSLRSDIPNSESGLSYFGFRSYRSIDRPTCGSRLLWRPIINLEVLYSTRDGYALTWQIIIACEWLHVCGDLSTRLQEWIHCRPFTNYLAPFKSATMIGSCRARRYLLSCKMDEQKNNFFFRIQNAP